MPARKRTRKRTKRTGSTNPPERRCEIYVRPDQERVLNQVSRRARKRDISRSELIFEILAAWLKREKAA